MKLDISFLTSEAPGDKLMVYSSCGDLVGFFTGRHLTSVETLAGCAGDGDDQIETASRRAQAIMSSYNTIPDLESEAQPLVAAPARKLGKTLVVVALFGFAAGAAAATAAPHVAAKMNLASGTAWTLGIGVRTGGGETYIDIDGSPTEGVATDATTMTTPAQEPAGTPIINTNGGVEKMSTDCGAASNGGGEGIMNTKCQTAGSNAGNGGSVPGMGIGERK